MSETEQVLDGRYRLLERLGGGGMSVVWRAYDKVLDRHVAVKVLAGGQTDGVWSRERIRREAQAAAGLSHPHVTAVHDYGESIHGSDDPVPYVVMELLTGQTLAERMASGPVPAGDALRITAEVAAALAAAHAHGLVHCDIKPANVMLTEAGAKVMDFGIAAAAGDQATQSPDGLVVGTPAYVAPERFTRGEVTPAADVYALGLVLYRLLAGGPPWPAESIMDRLEAHASLPPEPLPPTVPVSAKVAATCLSCLAKEPGERPSAYGLAMVLAEAGGWRVVPAPGGGIALGVAFASRPALGRLHRRMRRSTTVPLTVPRPVAGTGSSQAWRKRATRLTAAAMVGVVGVVAGWGLPDEISEQQPETSQAAPANPWPVPPLVPQPAPPGGEQTGGEQTGGDQAGDTGRGPNGTPPPTTGIVGGPKGGGGGTGSDLVSRPDGGVSQPGGGSSQPGGGSSDGGGAEAPAPHEPAPDNTAPAPDPEPTPTPRETTPEVVEQVKSLVTAGGTVVVKCVGSTASIVSVSPLVGFGILDIDRGPGAEVSVALKALLLTVRVTVRCSSGGVPQASIQIG